MTLNDINCNFGIFKILFVNCKFGFTCSLISSPETKPTSGYPKDDFRNQPLCLGILWEVVESHNKDNFIFFPDHNLSREDYTLSMAEETMPPVESPYRTVSLQLSSFMCYCVIIIYVSVVCSFRTYSFHELFIVRLLGLWL